MLDTPYLRRMRHPSRPYYETLPSLTWEQVCSIRERWAKGEATQAGMAREYHVCTATINNVIHHRTYKKERNA